MKVHCKKWIVLFSFLISSNLLAQHSGVVEDGFNVSDFPKVTFVYHSNNPDVLNRADFWHLKESGKNLDFDIQLCKDTLGNSSQTILFLWEDMAHNGYEQFDFTKKVLTVFFKSAEISSNDKFAVSVFNRRKNTPSVLKDLTNGFTSEKERILSAINSYSHSTEQYPDFPNRSDMYGAVREGMELLASEKTKAIIVFTSGYSMKNSGSDSEVQVLLKAQQLHIPVYIFQYFLKSGVAPEAEGFAKSTFGGFNSYKDATMAATALKNLYPQISQRYQGHDYKVTFTSNAARGTEARTIVLSVGGDEIQEQLIPPQHTLWSWVSTYPWWSILIGVIFVAIIIGAILFICRTKKNASQNQRELQELEQRRIKDKEEAENNRRAMENKARQEYEGKKRKEEEEKLHHLMAVKNLYPRLKCQVGSNSFTYEINSPETSIGREQDNDLILSNDMVSRHHAKIVFNGSAFEILDQKSTNKVIINGCFVERAVLRSGDVVGLGEAVLTFYL